jgi:predicted metal-dependent peptidase
MNRRLLGVPGIVFPKFLNLQYVVRILFAVDTSGSMLGELDKCFSYLMSLKKLNEGLKISLLTVDARVTSYVENVTQLPSHAEGLGGTDMTEVFKFADKEKLRYDLLLLLTDCLTDWPPPARVPKYYQKTIVLSVDSGSAYDNCPFRKYIIK